jgi:predicted nucleic acid-binding protein
MSSKFKRKRENKEAIKPKHHIDTDVLIDYLTSKDTARFRVANDYVNKIPSKFRGHLSIPVLGEFLGVVFNKYSSSMEERQRLLNSFDEQVSYRKITVMSTFKFERLLPKLHEFYLDSTDLQILLCAITDPDCACLVTTDPNLLNKELGKFVCKQYTGLRHCPLRIAHPKDVK